MSGREEVMKHVHLTGEDRLTISFTHEELKELHEKTTSPAWTVHLHWCMQATWLDLVYVNVNVQEGEKGVEEWMDLYNTTKGLSYPINFKLNEGLALLGICVGSWNYGDVQYRLEGYVDCPSCYGAGEVYCIASKTNPCGLCEGRGEVTKKEAVGYHEHWKERWEAQGSANLAKGHEDQLRDLKEQKENDG